MTLFFMSIAGIAFGCQYQRDVDYKPFFTGLEGAKTQTPASLSEEMREAYERPAGPTEIENPDGSVVLISRSIQDLMRHTVRTLTRNERELFLDQVLSQRSREQMIRAGKDPGETFDLLKQREADVAALFSLMPMGEYSPNAVLRKVGHKTYRVRVSGPGTGELWWTGLEAVQEEGQWRLGWFVP